MAAQLAQTQNIAAAQSPEQRERLIKLKDDPELKDMFEDIQANGPGGVVRARCTQRDGRQAPRPSTQAAGAAHPLQPRHSSRAMKCSCCAAAMQRYWNDSETMSKVSQKLNGMTVSSPEPSLAAPQKLGSKVRRRLSACTLPAACLQS